MKRILLLEDDRTLNNGITAAFAADDYEFTCCFTIAEARAAGPDYDLYLLDVNLPDGDGVAFCQELRRRQTVAPIALMTVKDMEMDIVYGLEAGADDYLTKPFTLMVLRAHVHALLRRTVRAGVEQPGVYRYREFYFDFQRMEFRKKEERIELSKTEQKLLNLLTENKNHIVPRGLLMEKLWSDGSDYVDENALSVMIKRLRTKLETHPARPEFIKTAYGLGYKWDEGAGGQ